jgi:glutamate dehydrogenase (NADP+)
MISGEVVTLSDSDGFVYDREGITAERLAYVKELKNVRRGRIAEYAKQFKGEYHAGQRPWGVKCDVALPAPHKMS